MADYMYLVQMDIPAELEDEFNRIYDTEHVPNISQGSRRPWLHALPPRVHQRRWHGALRRRVQH